jgi:hypothetical protein
MSTASAGVSKADLACSIMQIGLLAGLSCAALRCAAQDAPAHGGALTVTLENDTFSGSDNNYTNGLGLSWVSNAIDIYDERSFVRRWGQFWSFLPFVGNDGYRTYVSWSVAQEMHTPDDIEDPDPPLDDQPYAGILYLDNNVYAKGERWTHAWQLRVGVVGPSSQAETCRNGSTTWSTRTSPKAGTRSFRTSRSSTWVTRARTCWPEAI